MSPLKDKMRRPDEDGEVEGPLSTWTCIVPKPTVNNDILVGNVGVAVRVVGVLLLYPSEDCVMHGNLKC